MILEISDAKVRKLTGRKKYAQEIKSRVWLDKPLAYRFSVFFIDPLNHLRRSQEKRWGHPGKIYRRPFCLSVDPCDTYGIYKVLNNCESEGIPPAWTERDRDRSKNRRVVGL